jgi:steroid 5-alpha reductase family enzyme
VQVFLLQGIILLIVAAPVFIAFANGKELHSEVSIIGIVIWLIGFVVQTIADAHLAKFKNQKRPGEIMDKGLWKYSRHPNYFGELVMWWGLFLVVLPLQYGWVGVISPLTITYLLNYVSGVPMLEKRFDKNENYQRYKAQTSRLIPLMKKKVHE